MGVEAKMKYANALAVLIGIGLAFHSCYRVTLTIPGYSTIENYHSNR
jgi:hypothetical protein